MSLKENYAVIPKVVKSKFILQDIKNYGKVYMLPQQKYETLKGITKSKAPLLKLLGSYCLSFNLGFLT